MGYLDTIGCTTWNGAIGKMTKSFSNSCYFSNSNILFYRFFEMSAKKAARLNLISGVEYKMRLRLGNAGGTSFGKVGYTGVIMKSLWHPERSDRMGPVILDQSLVTSVSCEAMEESANVDRIATRKWLCHRHGWRMIFCFVCSSLPITCCYFHSEVV